MLVHTSWPWSCGAKDSRWCEQRRRDGQRARGLPTSTLNKARLGLICREARQDRLNINILCINGTHGTSRTINSWWSGMVRVLHQVAAFQHTSPSEDRGPFVMVINLLWLLVSIIVLCLVVYIIFWVVKSFVGIAIPDKIEKAIWLIVVLIILIWVISALMGVGPIRIVSLAR